MSSTYSSQEKLPLISTHPKKGEGKYVLVIHGGAGTMSRQKSTPAQQAEYKVVLAQALRAGYAVLEQGGEAMDATVAAVMVLENCPLFNAGKGAVFNTGGKNELETSIMLSKPPSTHPEIPTNRRGFALTLLTHTRNPCHLARTLYLSPKSTPHPFLSGSYAESIGTSLGVPTVPSSYFFTEARWREHRRGLGLPEEPLPDGHTPASPPEPLNLDQMPTGTVGAVALDVRGCICAVTSTGGRTNKQVGRVGDTPHMGSGFWAEEWKVKGLLRRTWNKLRGKGGVNALGVSGTGDGDFFIRQNTASTMARRMQYLGESVTKAADWVVEDLKEHDGVGGVIALDQGGNVALSLNCPGMYRGVIREDGVPHTAIFADEDLS